MNIRPVLELRPSISIRRFSHTIGGIESSDLGSSEPDALTKVLERGARQKGKIKTSCLIKMHKARI